MKTKQLVGLLILFTALVRSNAATIVDTGTNDGGLYWALGSTPYGAYPESLGARFTLSGDGTITSIEGYNAAYADANLDISIATDGGDIPGSNLYTATTFLAAEDGLQWHGISGLGWFLPAGNYWVVFSGQPSFSGYAAGRATNPLEVEAYTDIGNGQWYNGNALDIGVRIQGDVSPRVPDATPTQALLGIALLGLFGFSRRQPRATSPVA